MSRLRPLLALARACHPLPTLAVTAISFGLASLAGLSAGRFAALAASVFAGQLSVGWSNDYLDRARDAAVGRRDKPIATGQISARVVGIGAVLALATSIAIASTLGWRAAVVGGVTVASAWAYNLGLKSTPLSWLPYAASFGLAPAFATWAAPDPRWPAAWIVVAAGMLGTAAHFANVLPDLADDAATGVRGLPQRLGRRGATVGAIGLLLGASAATIWGPAGAPDAWAVWAGIGTGVMGVGAALVAWRRTASPRLFGAIIAIAVADVAILVAAGNRF